MKLDFSKYRKMNSKQWFVSIIFAILCSILVQLYLSDPAYESLLQVSDYRVGEVVEVSDFEEIDGVYASKVSGGMFCFNPSQEVSGLLIKFKETANHSLRINLFFTLNQKRDVLINTMDAPTDYYYIPLDRENYEMVELQILNLNLDKSKPLLLEGKEDPFLLKVENIFLITDEWSTSTLLLSKISFTTTLFLILCSLCLAILYFSYPSLKKIFFPYIALFLIVFVFLLEKPLIGDDSPVFINLASYYNFIDYVIMRHETWNGRFIIDVLPYFFVHSMEIWAFFTAGIVVLLLYSLEELIPVECKNKREIILLLLCFYPISTIYEVGWVATSVNYLWTATFLCHSFIPLTKQLRGESVSKFTYVASLWSSLYAANHEQGVALMLGFYLVFFLHFTLIHEKINRFLPHFCIGLCSIFYHLTVPANKVRNEKTIENLFPEFESYSLLGQLEMGYTSTILNLFTKNTNYLLILCCLLLFFGFKKVTLQPSIPKKEVTMTIVAQLFLFVPFSFLLLRTSFAGFISKETPILGTLSDKVTLIGSNPSFSNIESFYPLFLLTIVFFSFLLCLFCSIKEIKLALLTVIIPCAGLASRLIVGLTPVIIQDGERTYAYCYFAFLFVILIIYHEIQKISSEKELKCIRYALILLLCSEIVNAAKIDEYLFLLIHAQLS